MSYIISKDPLTNEIVEYIFRYNDECSDLPTLDDLAQALNPQNSSQRYNDILLTLSEMVKAHVVETVDFRTGDPTQYKLSRNIYEAFMRANM